MGSVPPIWDHLLLWGPPPWSSSCPPYGTLVWDHECPLCAFRHCCVWSASHIWVGTLTLGWPACLSKLPVLHQPPALSHSSHGHATGTCLFGSYEHLVLNVTADQSVSKQTAFLNKEWWESRHTGPTASLAHGGPSPQGVHARPSTSLDTMPQRVLGSALTHCCKGQISALSTASEARRLPAVMSN